MIIYAEMRGDYYQKRSVKETDDILLCDHYARYDAV